MKSSAWVIIVTILRPYEGYTWNTHQFLDSAFMHEKTITVEILGISHNIFSRSRAVFFDSEIPVTGAAKEILQPMVCVGETRKVPLLRRLLLSKSDAEGQSRTDTGSPPPVFECVAMPTHNLAWLSIVSRNEARTYS